MKDQSIRRHHAKRVIQKRLHIMKNRWSGALAFFTKKPGKLRKYNLSCGCDMCKACRKQGKPEDEWSPIEHLVDEQVDLPPDFQKVLDDEFWNLLGD